MMPTEQNTVTLNASDEARRLWHGALDAYRKPNGSLVEIFEALDLGLRAVEILVVDRLRTIESDLPATIGLLLRQPEVDVDVRSDAIKVPKTLTFTEVLDFLSEDSLECVGPRLHRGWEDRAFACRRSRRKAQAVIGITLGGEERDQLLTLAAFRNRIFRTPPPVRIAVEAIRAAFPALISFVEQLSDAPSPKAASTR